jgi:glycosyltransferase involved in cell wall biosynthesis
MKIVFVSNFFNHHQKSFSDNMYKITNGNFVFIESEPMEQERISMGWSLKNKPDYVKQIYRDSKTKNECLKLINDADVVIIGSAPEMLINERKRKNKMVFHYSERIFKQGIKMNWVGRSSRIILHLIKMFLWKRDYLLCASAYTAADFTKTKNYCGRTYKWGYFPETRKYDNTEKFISSKKIGSILWVARLIDWKHPEVPIEIAKRLKADGYIFDLNMIGDGVLEKDTKEKITNCQLQDCVHMLGSMHPSQVRNLMELSSIFLFTSDLNEGWGAVLNEAMNSGCAVVASHAIGATPYLIKNGKNGFVYKNGNIDDLYNKTKMLLDNNTLRTQCGLNAYKTIVNTWNAEVASERLLVLIESLQENRNIPFKDGPCSKAEILSNDWFVN